MTDEDINKLVGLVVLARNFSHKIRNGNCILCGIESEVAKSNLICETYIPDYASDITTSGEILEWVVKNSDKVFINKSIIFGYEIIVYTDETPIEIKELTLPRTICKAALELRKRI